MKPVDALLEILRGEGVEYVFGNPGTTELPLLDALVDAPDLRYVLGLQEASVVAMADGYARATGRTAFVNLHVAAGLANGLIGLLNASRSRTPMVVLAGQQDRRHLRADPMLSGDLVGIAAPVAKSAVEVHQAYDLPVLLRRAFALARRPPAGPVFVSVPMDLLEEDGPVAVPEPSRVAGLPAATALGDAVSLLSGASAPVVIAGDGVGREGAVPALVAVAERLGAVVWSQPMFDGVNFPGGHVLHRGMLPPRDASIRAALEPHDVVLIVGCHAFMPHHYTPGPAIPDGTAVVQLDSDQHEVGRNFPVAAGLVGAIGPTLGALDTALATAFAAGPADQAADSAASTAAAVERRLARIGERAARVAAETAAERDAVDDAARARYGPAPLDPLAAMHALAAGLPPDAVVVEEAITAGIALRSVYRPDRPKSYVHTVGGGLGWGIGAAVGSSLGDPARPVVAVLGDGSAMFGLQGLWSAARYDTPVTFVVVNNGEYRTLKDTLDGTKSRSTEQDTYLGLDLPGLDWQAAARLFGLASTRVGHTDELRALVAGAGDRTQPLLVEVPVTTHAFTAASGRSSAEAT
ncbi:thiamine pyrophosphate-binding protein [Cryptosporangium arvum]|uniref:Thiamine pyrophosphate-dependent enzyme, putative carboligase or decarboxylase n=1 Tax=Cryptosporangium arvum DSM 44712 TaxID=927661 RepID=A0A011AG69_9ACTN|nr:thiamine pyrophosphate-binding protein [Cryptosporangium arvum]EXG81021.1 thiamine pyrophosphate-dependent enzyme, putative carboligase or decarboxylase [Cryptosporangium arvum DSM 44712]